jgi:hypothetical protein
MVRTEMIAATSRWRRALSVLTAAATLVAAAAVPARATDLSAFLERAEKMAGYTKPARADIKVRRDDKLIDNAVVVIDPGTKRAFVALKSSGFRGLLPLGWGDGKVVKSAGAPPVSMSSDDALPETDLRAMEFFPFWKTDYTTAFVSDSNRLEKTVTLYGQHGVPYILFVVTFDKEKLVPVTIKYYKDNMNNLVRLRSDSDFEMVGSRPRPKRIEIRNFVENSTTTFELTWQALESVPAGLTDESSFDKASFEWASEPTAAR